MVAADQRAEARRTTRWLWSARPLGQGASALANHGPQLALHTGPTCAHVPATEGACRSANCRVLVSQQLITIYWLGLGFESDAWRFCVIAAYHGQEGCTAARSARGARIINDFVAFGWTALVGNPMTEQVVVEPPAVAHFESERRRPGRVPYQSDHLIELLRDPTGSPADAGNAVPVDGQRGDIGTSEDDPLSAAKGIMNGVLISLVFWLIVGAAMWVFWRG